MGIFSKKTKPTKIESLDDLAPMLESGKPVLLDLMQTNCQPCRVMDGIVNELAHEYGESAHIVKVDVTKVPGAAAAFAVRSTPTFVLLGTATKNVSKKAQRKGKAAKTGSAISPRWRQAGLVKKDLAGMHVESHEKRIFATAIGLAVPDMRKHSFAVADRHNYDRGFPHQTIASIVNK